MDQCIQQATAPGSHVRGRPGLSGIEVALRGLSNTAMVECVGATDLQELTRTVNRARAQQPGCAVRVDIFCVIATEAAAARARAAGCGTVVPDRSLSYVGTPRGLVSLIRDLETLHLADVVCLYPSQAATDGELVQRYVLPALRAGLPDMSARSTQSGLPLGDRRPPPLRGGVDVAHSAELTRVDPTMPTLQ